MGKANVPGFTAEAALYAGGKHYQTVGIHSTVAMSGQVFPQALNKWYCNDDYCCIVTTIGGPLKVPYLICRKNPSEMW